MKITVMETEHDFDVAAAWRIIGQMLEKPRAIIGLSTRQTTGNMHRIVSEIYEKYPFDTSKATIFNVDELTNLDRSYPGSCYAMIYEQVIKNLHIPEKNFIMPPPGPTILSGSAVSLKSGWRNGEASICRCSASAGTGISASTSPAPPSSARPGFPQWTRSLKNGFGGRPACPPIIPWAG